MVEFHADCGQLNKLAAGPVSPSHRNKTIYAFFRLASFVCATISQVPRGTASVRAERVSKMYEIEMNK